MLAQKYIFQNVQWRVHSPTALNDAVVRQVVQYTVLYDVRRFSFMRSRSLKKVKIDWSFPLPSPELENISYCSLLKIGQHNKNLGIGNITNRCKQIEIFHCLIRSFFPIWSKFYFCLYIFKCMKFTKWIQFEEHSLWNCL